MYNVIPNIKDASVYAHSDMHQVTSEILRTEDICANYRATHLN